MGPGELGGLIGTVGGVCGGLIGTWCSIRNTNGPRERAFVIKASLLCWVAIVAFLAGLMALPSPYRFLLWLPYAILLVAGISVFNRKQWQLRQDESREADAD